nr:phosphosulfolactate synthase [Paenibacillus larvae]
MERAVHQQMADSFLKTASELGFTGIEVSDGTTTLSRSRRSELIIQGLDYGFSVFTEYGKRAGDLQSNWRS